MGISLLFFLSNNPCVCRCYYLYSSTNTPIAVSRNIRRQLEQFCSRTKSSCCSIYDNIHYPWQTNNTENGNEEVMFRASNRTNYFQFSKVNLNVTLALLLAASPNLYSPNNLIFPLTSRSQILQSCILL